ncbi:MAG TPA: UMP kinase [Clostridiales bacterium]|nr:UMP kinase [Clostridiales bacterium]
MKSYKRVLLKLSGEALAGIGGKGFDEGTCIKVADQVQDLLNDGIQVSVVIGGGNFWRGRTSETIDRTKADQIGMLATVMNCIYVSEIFRHLGMKTKVFTSFTCGNMSELFSKDNANEFLNQGGVAFLAGGTGHPYFSTDTATVLRAIELDSDIILVAKSIDGVYDSDPESNKEAIRYDEVSLQQVLDMKLRVLDLTATVMALENNMPMLIFGLKEENSIIKAAKGEKIGTKVFI